MKHIFIEYILPAALFALTASIFIIGYLIDSLKRQIKDLRIREALHQREEEMRHQILLEQIKQQKDKCNTVDDLQHLFGQKFEHLHHKYPELTELDIQVLTLIGLGVDTTEIIQITDMSKRTYYKRRQLIAKRMNTSAAQLDAVAKELFTSNL